MRRSSRKTLEALAASIGPAALKALLTEIRNAKHHEIEALIVADVKAAAGKAKRPPRNSDPLVAEVTALLAPILARSGEKADMLTDHLEQLTGRTLGTRGGGLASTIKALRKVLSEDDIRDGAFGLRVAMGQAHSMREKVK
jgi:hypothetical protein